MRLCLPIFGAALKVFTCGPTSLHRFQSLPDDGPRACTPGRRASLKAGLMMGARLTSQKSVFRSEYDFVYAVASTGVCSRISRCQPAVELGGKPEAHVWHNIKR